MIIDSIPVVGSICKWWETRSQTLKVQSVSQAFEKQLQAPSSELVTQTVALIDAFRDNRALKKEVSKLERIYFQFLQQTNKPLPPSYRTAENRDLVATLTKLGISEKFLVSHPDFLTLAREKFWHLYFPFVQMPIQMRNGELYLPVEIRENSGRYVWRSWAEMQKLSLNDYRLTYKGFAAGHPDASSRLVPLKTVDAGGKYAIQFVTSCPLGRSLPSSLDFKDSGHSFTQIIIPKNRSQAEVFSVGFYPRKVADFGLQFFKEVPGVYRNHDSNVSRIQAGQVVPIVKQYVFHDDYSKSPCLLSLVEQMKPICRAFKARGIACEEITLADIEKAMLERNEPELDRILIELTEMRKRIAASEISIFIPPMSRAQKAEVMKKRFENAQGRHSYHMLGANCTAASFREEAFAVAFLDAVLDQDKPIQVYASQVDLRDHQFGLFDRVRNILERVFLHFFAALPITGWFLGTGSTHPDAPNAKNKFLVPSVLSETAFATHQLLVSPFVERPLFPAGEIVAGKTPVIKPPSFFSRLKYLWRRAQLFKL